MAMAITASTLTTVAGFFPLVFVEGVAGQLFKDSGVNRHLRLVGVIAGGFNSILRHGGP